MHSNNNNFGPDGGGGGRPGFTFSRTLSVFSNFNSNNNASRGMHMTAEEQKTLAVMAQALPLNQPIDIKDFPRHVARKKKNKAELKAEFMVSYQSTMSTYTALPESPVTERGTPKGSPPSMPPNNKVLILLNQLPGLVLVDSMPQKCFCLRNRRLIT